MKHAFLGCNFKHLNSDKGRIWGFDHISIKYCLCYRNSAWDQRFRDKENTLNPKRFSSLVNKRDKKQVNCSGVK